MRKLAILPLLLGSTAVVAAATSDAWRAELQQAMATHWAGVAGCTLEPLETFTLYLGADGLISEVDYAGFDARERLGCLEDVLVGTSLPAPSDGMAHGVVIRVEDPDLDMGFTVEEVSLRCDAQVVDLAAHQAVFEAAAKDMKRCQVKRLLIDRTMRGEVTLSYTVLPNGVVDRAEVTASALDDAKAHACLVEEVKRLRFPEPTGGCTVTLEQNLDFGLPGLLAREADVAERVAEIKPGAILACGGKPDDAGAPTVVVKIHIERGEVTNASQLEAYFVDEAQAACLTNATRGWTFPGIEEGRSVVHFRMEDPELPGF